MKKYLFMASIALLFAACSNNDIDVKNNSNEPVPVTIRVEDFSISKEDFPTTRSAESLATYDGVKAITLAFYAADGTEVYKHEQLRADNTTYNTFGEFSCSLPVGAYTMVVIGRGLTDGDVFVLTSPTEAAYTSERARETFCGTQDVIVSGSTPLNLTITLNRICAKLKVLSKDNRTANVAQYRTTYAKGGKSFNPSTGLATSNTGFTITNSTGAVGEAANFNSYLFLATDEQEMDVTIEALDADGNILFSKKVENVPFQRNSVTTLTGNMFTADASTATFQVETEWKTGTTVNF